MKGSDTVLPRPLRALLLALPLAMLASGCIGTPTLSFPTAPNPVLIGPIGSLPATPDGAAKANPPGPERFSVDAWNAVQYHQGGPGPGGGVSTTSSFSLPGQLSFFVMMEFAQGQPDVRLRVDEVACGEGRFFSGHVVFCRATGTHDRPARRLPAGIGEIPRPEDWRKR